MAKITTDLPSPRMSPFIFVLLIIILILAMNIYSSLANQSFQHQKQELSQQVSLNAVLIQDKLLAIERAKTEYSRNKNTQEALSTINKLWQSEPIQKAHFTLYLVQKQTKNDPLESVNTIRLSSTANLNSIDTNTLQKAKRVALQPNQPVLVHSAYTDIEWLKDILFTQMTTSTVIVPNKWGLVVELKHNFMLQAILKTGGFVVYIAVLLLMFVWLILSLRVRKLHSKALQNQARFLQLVDHSLDWIWETDIDGYITYSSPQATQLLGVKSIPLNTHKLSDFFASGSNEQNQLVWQQQQMLKQAFNNLEVDFAKAQGETVHALLSGHPIFNKKNQWQGYRGTARDITHLRSREKKMTNLALYDALTGLANRSHFLKHLANFLSKKSPVQSMKPAALLFLDLDGFKLINDTAGHEIGDEVLKIVAKRLLSLAKESTFVSRLGGDEFVILSQNNNKTRALHE